MLERDRDDADDVHPEGEAQLVGLPLSYELQYKLYEEDDEDGEQDPVERLDVRGARDDPEVRQEERQQQHGKHEDLEAHAVVDIPGELLHLPAPLGPLAQDVPLVPVRVPPRVSLQPVRLEGVLVAQLPERQMRVLRPLEVANVISENGCDVVVSTSQGLLHDRLPLLVAQEGVRLLLYEHLDEGQRRVRDGLVQPIWHRAQL
mmetsp:Transcript_26559/g.76237  ORF Transcript_26559/g.76237 Transcript_26559/m.76237 type:complete len:203 (+) Transcript_26559:2231-2839(+)